MEQSLSSLLQEVWHLLHAFSTKKIRPNSLESFSHFEINSTREVHERLCIYQKDFHKKLTKYNNSSFQKHWLKYLEKLFIRRYLQGSINSLPLLYKYKIIIAFYGISIRTLQESFPKTFFLIFTMQFKDFLLIFFN